MKFKFLLSYDFFKKIIKLIPVLFALIIAQHFTFKYFSKLGFETHSSSNQSVQLFFSSNLKEYSPRNSKWVSISSGKNYNEIYYPYIGITKIRIDLDANKNIGLGPIQLRSVIGEVTCSQSGATSNQSRIESKSDILWVYSNKDENDPYVSFPCQNFSFSWQNLISSTLIFISLFLLQLFFIRILALAFFKYSFVDVKKRLNLLSNLFILRPYVTLLVVSILGVTIASSQVIFFGQSFVSPLGTSLIYSDNPSLPGYKFERIYNYHGSDTGATMWQHIPYTFLTGDAIRNNEIPLWNRFNGAGRSLIGQGQAMVAEPINLLIAISGFTSEKYDIKYIFLKFLFSFSIGISLYILTGKIIIASIIGFLSIFISFFLFRLNHPGYFTFAYSPLVLMSYFIFARSQKVAAVVISSLILLISNWLLLTSGTGKEAYLALVIYNILGFIYFFKNQKNKIVTSYLIFTIIVFFVTSFPQIVTFIDYIVSQKSGYSEPGATQYSLLQFFSFAENIGFLSTGSYQPGLNFPLFFLYILGLIFIFTRKYFQSFNKFIFFVTSLFCIAVAFGLVPAEFIKKIPFLNSVHHVNDVFSSLAIPIIILCSGFVLVDVLRDKLSFREKQYFSMIVVLLLIFAFAFNNFYFNSKIFIYLAYSLISIFLFFKFLELLFLLRNGEYFTLKQCTFFVFILIFFTFRNIQWPHTDGGISQFVFVPSSRANLKPEIAVLEKWKNSNLYAPYRAIGIEGTMFSGYRAIYGIESLDGPDALFPKYYRTLSEALQLPYGWYWRLEFSNENIQTFKNSLDFLNVGYIFSEKSIGFNEIPKFDGDGLLVYQRDQAWPRAFFTNCPKVVADTDVLTTVTSAVQAGSKNFVIIPESSTKTSDNKSKYNSCTFKKVIPATNYVLTSNSTSFHISAPSAGFIYLGENFEDGNFIAKANGINKNIIRANYAFKGIFLDSPGDYNITFEYLPRYFLQSLKVAGVTGILYFLITIFLLSYSFFMILRAKVKNIINN